MIKQKKTIGEKWMIFIKKLHLKVIKDGLILFK